MTGKTNQYSQGPLAKELQPVLEKAKQAGIGLVGMKAGRFIAGRAWLGWGIQTHLTSTMTRSSSKPSLAPSKEVTPSFWKMAST